MDTTIIDTLIMEYRKDGNQTAYVELYGLLGDLREINARVLLRSGYAQPDDAQTVFDDVLLRVIHRDYTGGFIGYFSASLRNARIDFIRKEKRLRDRTLSLDAAMDDEGMTLVMSIPSDMDTESDALRDIRQAECSELVRSLIDSGNLDAITYAIMNNLPSYPTLNALAIGLGVHHSVVIRKLRKLAQGFDMKRYGIWTDYST